MELTGCYNWQGQVLGLVVRDLVEKPGSHTAASGLETQFWLLTPASCSCRSWQQSMAHVAESVPSMLEMETVFHPLALGWPSPTVVGFGGALLNRLEKKSIKLKHTFGFKVSKKFFF